MASNGSASTEEENNLAYLNDQGKVKSLWELITIIETFLNIFQPDRWGRTSLMIACLQGSKDIVKHRIPYSLMTIPSTVYNFLRGDDYYLYESAPSDDLLLVYYFEHI